MKTKGLALIFGGITFSQLFALMIAYFAKPITVLSINPNGTVTAIVNSTAENLSSSNISSHMVVQAISPFGVGALGSLVVSASLVLGSLIMAFILVLLLRKGYINYVISAILGTASFLLNYYVLSFFFGYVSLISIGVPFSLAVIIAAYGLYPRRFRGWPQLLVNFLVLINGAELGFFLAASFEKLTVVFLAFLFSAYDFYSVFRGPISRMLGRPGPRGQDMVEVTEKPERGFLGPMLVNFGEVEMGLGDITFYSMMPTAIFVEGMGTGAVALEILLIDVGVAATLLLLRKIRPLPGLPIPLLLGLVAYLLRGRPSQKLNGVTHE
ncbi:MAG: hypothetical protein ACP5GO_02460 [Thermoprotei archaeon]